MEKTDRGLQIKYSMAQGGYWLVAAVLGVFVTPILLYKGFNEFESRDYKNSFFPVL